MSARSLFTDKRILLIELFMSLGVHIAVAALIGSEFGIKAGVAAFGTLWLLMPGRSE